MRTPWKFVADLVSRKPRTDVPEEKSAESPKVEALEHTQSTDMPYTGIEAVSAESSSFDTEVREADSEPRVGDEITPIVEAAPEELPTAETAHAAPSEQHDVAVSEATVERTAGKAASGTSPIEQKPKRRKLTEPAVKRGLAANQATEQKPIARPAIASFADEMAELDLEVGDLRRQLSKKLAEQNAQLRKMLARFDAR